jgi:SAM-dependent methyltransferase
MRNLDAKTVAGFGAEWQTYDQSAVVDELEGLFQKYFRIFPWSELPPAAVGFDAGCGSGRWARFVAPRVGRLYCIDASEQALDVARRNLCRLDNCRFLHESIDEMSIPAGSMDFGYSLGVLHHVPDTAAGIRACVDKLKPGAPFLLYLYYAFDNRPRWFRALWQVSDLLRRVISSLPHPARLALTRVIAATVYWPLARSARVIERLGGDPSNVPLSAYRHHSFYTMQTDALDRFGTPLEQRFTAAAIRRLMEDAGLVGIEFNEQDIFWCAVGRRRG